MVADLCHFVLSCLRGETAPRENPPNGDSFVFSQGDLSPFHTKVRHFSCVAFSPPVCRIFVWRGERLPRENPQKSPFSGLSRGDLSPRQAKNATFHALRFRLLFVISLSGGAKGRHAKTRQNHHLAGFRMATFRVFALKTRLYDMAQISQTPTITFTFSFHHPSNKSYKNMVSNFVVVL